MFLAKSYCDIGNYVVGMGKGIVYRYDKNGVNAVFPINIAK